MIAAGPVRLLALSASMTLAAAGSGNAHTAPKHTAASAGHFGRNATAITFSAAHSYSGASFGRHGGREFVSDRAIGRFGTHFAVGRHGRSAGEYASRGHSGGGIQCVTFARADSGIELSGNASAWWDNAAGIYDRGARPEAGSVLNFRANGAMRMGHVAVVDQVVNSRTIEIDHANWGGPGAVRGGISRDISVVDVSPANDWSAVRVALGHSGEYGSIYPTYGFIYNRPDSGRMVTAQNTAEPVPALNPAPRDLRGRTHDTAAYDEVAEAPDSAEPVGGFHHPYAGHRHHHFVAAAYPAHHSKLHNHRI